MARRRGVDLNACGYSDDGVPLADLECRDSSGEAYAAAYAREQQRVQSVLRAAGIACRPSDTVYLWLSARVSHRYFWAASAAEAYIRADARTSAEKAKVTRCGPGCGEDDAAGRRRGRMMDHEYFADSDIL